MMIKKKMKTSYDEVHLMLLLNHDFHLIIVQIEMMFEQDFVVIQNVLVLLDMND